MFLFFIFLYLFDDGEERVRLEAPRERLPGPVCRCRYHVAVRECSRGIFSTPPKQAASCSGYLGTAVAPGDAFHPTKLEVTELEELR